MVLNETITLVPNQTIIPSWGYRQAHQLSTPVEKCSTCAGARGKVFRRRPHQHLLDQGWAINRKRTQRLWREEGLRVPAKRRKRERRGESHGAGGPAAG